MSAASNLFIFSSSLVEQCVLTVDKTMSSQGHKQLLTGNLIKRLKIASHVKIEREGERDWRDKKRKDKSRNDK